MTNRTDDQPGTGADSATYGEALAELEDLLDELEGADIDVDRLAERVARGAELIRFCRARLDVVTAEVDEVVAELITVDGTNQDTDQDQDPDLDLDQDLDEDEDG